MRRAKPWMVCIAAGFLLTGCVATTAATTLLDTANRTIFQRQDVNLTEKNYAAADYLITQAESYIGDADHIAVHGLAATGQPGITSEIGRRIPAEIGVRLSQLGYHMDLSRVQSGAENALGVPAGASTRSPAFNLTGSYERGRSDLGVRLQITESATGRVVGAFQYSMPMDREIARLSEPQTRIFKVSE